MTRASTMFLFVLAVAVAGCPSAGGETPQETFDQWLSYVRDGDYDRVWTLWTPNYQREYTKSLDKQKRGFRDMIAGGGANAEMARKFIADQYGLGPDAYLAAPAHELAARSHEYSRARLVGLRIVGEVRVEGNRATLRVAPSEKEVPAEWRLVRDEEGKWLVDEIPVSAGDSLR